MSRRAHLHLPLARTKVRATTLVAPASGRSVPMLRLQRVRWIALVLIIVTAGPAHAQDVPSEFTAGVTAYQQGMFDTALVHFERLLTQNVDDAAVWYNLGNTHFKLGRIGESLAAYRRGLKLTPRDEDLVANYRYVRLFASDKIEPAPRMFLAAWWETLWSHVNVAESRGIAILAFWLAVGLWSLRIWRAAPVSGRRRMSTALLVGVCLLWLASFGGSLTTHHRDLARRDAVITSLASDVRGGPGMEFTLQFVAHDGLECTIDRVQSNWALVAFANGLKGWIDRSALVEI